MRADEFLHVVAQSSDEAAIVTDGGGIIRWINARAAGIIGCDIGGVSGRPIGQVITLAAPAETMAGEPGHRSRWRRAATSTIDGGARGEVDVAVSALHDRDGEAIAYAYLVREPDCPAAECAAGPPPLTGAARLAAGFAHDFDNVLAIASGHLQIAEMRIDDPVARDSIRQALLACVMGQRMTHRLKDIARAQPSPAERFLVNDVVEALVRAIMQPFDGRIGFEMRLANDLPEIFCDRSGFECALMNLLLNAIDAILNNGANCGANCGRLSVAAERQGAFLAIEVEDTGIGMSEAVAARAFEPFFSTKPPGANCGLGLTAVASFIAAAGGRVRLTSRLGEGTRVSLDIPVADATPQARVTRAAKT